MNAMNCGTFDWTFDKSGVLCFPIYDILENIFFHSRAAITKQKNIACLFLFEFFETSLFHIYWYAYLFSFESEVWK